MRNEEIESKIKAIIKDKGSYYMSTLIHDKILMQYLKYELFNNFKISIPTKIYWMINNIKDYPVCSVCGKQVTRDVQNIFQGYCQGSNKNIHCSLNCSRDDETEKKMAKQTKLLKYGNENYVNTKLIKMNKLKNHGDEKWNNRKQYKETCIKKYGKPNFVNYQKAKNTRYKKYNGRYESKETTEKRNKTCIEKYGVENPLKNKKIINKRLKTMVKLYGVKYASQSPELIAKSRARYYYGGMQFHSKPELAYYIWLIDNNEKFIFHPVKMRIRYKDKFGKEHLYYPDFYIESSKTLVEIKGDNQFDSNGNMINISNRNLDYVAQAKYECMIKNHVKIIRNKEYKKYLDYVKNKYGSTYLQSFKRRK